MPRVIFQVGDTEKALMVEAAHRELVSLSEWLRRAAEVRLNGGLVAGAAEGGDGLAQRRPVTGSGRGAEAGEADTDPGLIAGGTEISRHAPATSPTKKCSREARHHINHSGKPCPECGYPTA